MGTGTHRSGHQVGQPAAQVLGLELVAAARERLRERLPSRLGPAQPGEQGAPGGAAGPDAGATGGPQAGGGDDVVDAEIVDEDKK
jgi:molecular chaperone DnaK